MSSPKLRIVDVAKVFGRGSEQVTALQNTSFDVHEGEFVTILGPSGCGKSTILNIIAGLVTPSSGQVLLDGKPISGPGPDRGMVFQSYTLFPWLTVRQNVEFGLRVKKVPAAEREAVVEHFLSVVGLSAFANAYPAHLSGGMKQRVAIARALANDPEILLMDEPFGALDAQTRTVMQELLLQVWGESRKTILFVTHDIDEAIFLADRIYVMTARPGSLKAEVKVPLPRPRSYEMKTDETFTPLKRELLELIRSEAWKAANEA